MNFIYQITYSIISTSNSFILLHKYLLLIMKQLQHFGHTFAYTVYEIIDTFVFIFLISHNTFQQTYQIFLNNFI